VLSPPVSSSASVARVWRYRNLFITIIIITILLKQVGFEMTLEGAQSRIWCSKIGWQTVCGPLTAKLP